MKRVQKIFDVVALFIIVVFCFAMIVGYSNSYAMSWSGSGFFVGTNGYIATAAHVAGNRETRTVASHLEVVYHGKTYVAKVVAIDYIHDVAIIKIDVTGAAAYSTTVAVTEGESVYAIGHPLGNKDDRITEGTVKDSTDGAIYTDVYLCHGNSGGVLVNQYGSAVGVTVATYTLGSDMYCAFTTIASGITYVEQLMLEVGVPLIPQGTVVKSKKDLIKSAVQDDSVPIIYGEG